MLLVENRSKTRRPDLWMICIDNFTEDELKPYLGIMRKLRIRILPDGVKCRIGRPLPKDVVIKIFEAGYRNKGN